MKDMLNLSLRLAIICGVASLLLTQVDAFTKEPIRLAMLKAKMEAVEAVLPPYNNAPDADMVALGAAETPREYYRGFAGEALSGVAFKAVTYQGYSGEIELMLGVDQSGRVQGVRVLTHAETPGLGAKYADPAVLSDFYAGRDLEDTNWKVRKDGGDLDAVTGATVTGRAIGEAIDAALRQFAEDREPVFEAQRSRAAVTEDQSSAEVQR